MSQPIQKRGFAVGALFTAFVCIAATGGIVYAFLANSSQYVTIAQARVSHSDRVHMAGDLIKSSIRQDLAHHAIVFDLKDQTGQMTVVYTGDTTQNLDEATKVVAVGACKGNRFYSDKMLVKCPSKYESEKGS